MPKARSSPPATAYPLRQTERAKPIRCLSCLPDAGLRQAGEVGEPQGLSGFREAGQDPHLQEGQLGHTGVPELDARNRPHELVEKSEQITCRSPSVCSLFHIGHQASALSGSDANETTRMENARKQWLRTS
jgi:hypothetical protein